MKVNYMHMAQKVVTIAYTATFIGNMVSSVFCFFLPKNTIYEKEQKVTMDKNVDNNR